MRPSLALALTTTAALAFATVAQAATLEIVPVPDGGVEDGASVPLGTLDLGVAEEGTVSALRRIFRETGSTGAMLAVVPKVLEEDDTLHVARTLLALGEVSDGQLEAARTNLSRIEEAELEIPEVDMLRAMLARESGDIAAARTHIARALAADPEHGYAFHIRATLALAEGDTGSALQDFEAATRFAPEGAHYWSNLGVTLVQIGAIEAAANALDRAVTLSPGACPTLVGLSILRRQEGKAAAAVERLNECLDADPNNTAAAELLVSTQIQMGDITGARESFGQVRRLLPDDALWDAALSLREGQYARVSEGLEISPSRDAAQGLILAGASALAQGNLDRASTQLSAALEADPAAVTAQVGLFALDLAKGSTPEFDTASGGVDPQIDAFYRALSRTDGRLPDIEAAENILPGMTFDGLRAQDTDRALTPDHVQALAKAMFLLLLDAPHGAQSVLAELEYDLPYPALSGYLQAYAAAKSGQTDMATQTALLEQVTAAAPGFFAAQVMYAETLLQQNRPGTALNAYKAAAQTRETGPVLLRIGLLGEATGDGATAEDGYRRFAALEPNSHIALNQLAWFLASRGRDLEDAQELASRANELRPGNASILDTLGWLAYLRQDLDTSLMHLREANEISNGQNAEIRFHLAQVEMAAGNRIEALFHFEALDANQGPPLPFANDVKAALAQLKN